MFRTSYVHHQEDYIVHAVFMVLKLSVYDLGVFTKLNKIVFTSQTQVLFLYLMYYSGNMFRLAIESSSGPYIKIKFPNSL
jgi:hypothetical protein